MALIKSLSNVESMLKTKIVDVPELGEGAQVMVREMSAARMNKYQKAVNELPDYPVEHIMIACMVDENGRQCHKHDDAWQISEALTTEVKMRIFEACKEVNESLFTSMSAKKKK